MRRTLATLATLLAAALAAVDARPPSPQGVTGVLHVTVTVVDADGKPTPVPRHALLISDDPATAEPRQVITRLDGTVDVTLRAGKYIVESDRPVMYRGKAYSWLQNVDIAAGQELALALTIANAEIEGGTSGAGPTDDDTAFVLPLLNDSVVGLWTPTSHASGFVADANGLLVTNQQAVGTATTVEAQVSPAVKVAARVLVADAARDVAVLWMEPSVAPALRPAPLGCDKPPTAPIEVGQPLVAIGVSLRQSKEMDSAKVAAIAVNGLSSDLTVATGSHGGPVFTPRGAFVGLTSTFPDKDPNAKRDTRVVRGSDVCAVLAAARPAMQQGPPPSGARLPIESARTFPKEAYKAAAAKRAGSLNPLVVTGAAFEAAFITPMNTFGTEYQTELLRKRTTAPGKRRTFDGGPPVNPLLEFSNWSDYVGDYPPVLLIRVTPKMAENFWTTVGRVAAMTQGMALPPIKRFKSGFSRLRAFCGETEVTPIHPFKLERRVSETDAIYEGLYAYDPDALGPACKGVRLMMYSDKEPDKPDTRVVEPAVVQQVWQDFDPYRTTSR